MDEPESADERLRCPVCGAVELTFPPYAEYTGQVPDGVAPPYENWLGPASYEVCPSCGFEFGHDDNPGTGEPSTFLEYRLGWLAAGRPRFR